MTHAAGDTGDDDDEAWVPVRIAAEWVRLDRRSIYMWIKRYDVRHRLDDAGRMIVNLPDVTRIFVATRAERDRKLARREPV